VVYSFSGISWQIILLFISLFLDEYYGVDAEAIAASVFFTDDHAFCFVCIVSQYLKLSGVDLPAFAEFERVVNVI
tara:strand:+ start:367 stop:591 length:225 start_codon:yes stop_codon:yes gene_type:complete